jgi:hypothetical protein
MGTNLTKQGPHLLVQLLGIVAAEHAVAAV